MGNIDSSEPITKKSSPTNRRKFLKVGAVLTAAGILKQVPEVLLQSSLNTVPNDMSRSIPLEFSTMEIPSTNPKFRNSDEILQEALDTYNNWRTRSELKPIAFTPRSNYLSLAKLLLRVPRTFDSSIDRPDQPLQMKIYDRLSLLLASASNEQDIADSANREVYAFSAMSISGISDLLRFNVGAGIVEETLNQALSDKSWTRIEFYEHLKKGEIPESDYDVYRKRVSQALTQAQAYFEAERTKKGAPLSVSLAISYFLHRNEGDLYAAMWDSTLFLKLLVRNDLVTLSTKETYEQAARAAFLFEDEFSPHISCNWLVRQFETGQVNNSSVLFSRDPFAYQQYKDFMPINRAGGLYHAVNLMTMAAVCMDPEIAQALALAYYKEESLGFFGHRAEHGVEKVTADVLAVKRAKQIKNLVSRNTNYSLLPS